MGADRHATGAGRPSFASQVLAMVPPPLGAPPRSTSATERAFVDMMADCREIVACREALGTGSASPAVARLAPAFTQGLTEEAQAMRRMARLARLELGTPEEPLRLPQALAPSRNVTHAIAAAVAACGSQAGLDALTASRGPEEMDFARAFCAMQALAHRAALEASARPDAPALRDALLQRLVHLAACPSVAARMCAAQADGFVGTLASHAARALDVEALEATLAAGPRQDWGAIDMPFGPEGTVNAEVLATLARVALASPRFRQAPEAGRTLLRALFRHGEALAAEASWQERWLLVDDLAQTVVLARRLEGMPLLVERAAALRARTGTSDALYLLWCLEEGFGAGARALLDAGLCANAREPGVHLGHPALACGLTPLMVAAQSTRFASEAERLEIVELLLRHGARPRAHMLAAPGDAPVTAFGLAARVGHRAIAARLMAAELEAPAEPDMALQAAAPGAGVPPERLALALAQALAQLATALPVLAGVSSTEAQVQHLAARLGACTRALLDGAGQALAEMPARVLLTFLQASGELLLGHGWRHSLHRAHALPRARPVDFCGRLIPASTRARTRLQMWAEHAVRLQPLLRGIQGRQGAPASAGPLPDAGAPSESWARAVLQPLQGQALGRMRAAHALMQCRAQQALLTLELDPRVDLLERRLCYVFAHCSLEVPEAPRPLLRRIVEATIAQIDDDRAAWTMVEAALLLGDEAALGAMLTRIAAARLDLLAGRPPESLATLLHAAARAPTPLLGRLARRLGHARVAAQMGACDAEGNTPVHLAAVAGLASVRVLRESCTAAAFSAAALVRNAAGRTPAMEALAHGHVGAFAYLGRQLGGPTAGAVLCDVLCQRRGQLDADFLQVVGASDAGARLLRANAGALAALLVRLNDAAGLAAVLAREPLAAQAPSPLGQNVLHVAAACERPALLPLLREHLGEPALRTLAAHLDAEGRRPEELATRPAFIAQLAALRGVRRPRALAAADHAYLALRKQVDGLGSCTGPDALEAALQDVARACAAAQRLHAELQPRVQALGWDAVLIASRAPFGPGMGAHLQLHAPEQPLAFLRQRAGETRSGASRFGAGGALPLLRGRAEALEQAASVHAIPGERLVLEVPCPGLGGCGYAREASGSLRAFSDAQRLRVVLRRTAEAWCVVTMHPV